MLRGGCRLLVLAVVVVVVVGGRLTVHDAAEAIEAALEGGGSHQELAAAYALFEASDGQADSRPPAHVLATAAECLMQLGRSEDAVSLYERALVLQPSTQAHLLLARLCREYSDLDRAFIHVTSAFEHIAYTGTEAGATLARAVSLEKGVIYSLKNDPSNAVIALLKAVQGDSLDGVAAAALAGLAVLSSLYPATIELPEKIRLMIAAEENWMATEYVEDCAATFFAMASDDWADDLDNKTALARLLQTETDPVHPRTVDFFSVEELDTACQGQSFGIHSWFLVKPERLSDGRGITIHKTQSAAAVELKSRGPGHLAQEYIRPQLLQHRKFDLRLYLFITDKQWYVHRHAGFVRFAVERHTWDSTAATQHLTNTALAKHVGNELEMNCVDGSSESAIWSIQAALNLLGTDASTFWANVATIVEELRKRTASSTSFQLTITPQLLGLDLMLDSAGKLWILEMNRKPYFQSACPMQRQLKATLLKDAMRLGLAALKRTCSSDDTISKKSWIIV